MIRIENKKTYRGDGIYIGRPSLWGNPFKIGRDGTRTQVVQLYRGWLWEQIKQRGEIYRQVKQLAATSRQSDLILICWCKERSKSVVCHGDILAAAVMWMAQQDESLENRNE